MSSLQAIKQRFGIVGKSPALEHALQTASRVSSTDLTVLISGESGVGKEVFSKVIHHLSPRKHNQLIAINCGAIPEGTINSELFGHEKGSFTGATSDRKGYFETADKGTIFLDEIGEMPLDTQAYLLRVLENGEYVKVGSSVVHKTDVRVIAATNVNLLERVKNGKFREDLYYRLNTVPIEIPSLRERREDIFVLFRRFAVDFSDKYNTQIIRLDEQARLLIENYNWPGNIRELKNVVEQLSVLSDDAQISAEQLVTLIPNITKRNLPSISGGRDQSFEEREILYKLLFEMKSDLNDLKSLVFELIQTNNLKFPQMNSFQKVSQLPESFSDYQTHGEESHENYKEDHQPILIDHSKPNYQDSEIVEENLSLDEMQKEWIKKALKKHGGRRKDAADELGISERTLYRKIKEYEI
ncbi:sigma-54 interaction domain-containing protein [Portibacter lacus]|uniref:Sigma-54-dependent Fis family transcriptional regulator n=1 Tax=Portibacter lacus TaxID=1099794 RepID=A0AA37WHN1_9BACT|nr:sigma-54 dependent transcriptional regulator [Portibacter lacus]GLR19649.1 sigma-54-dependent Fis family transcriptional regulator [Portibacter lacus]